MLGIRKQLAAAKAKETTKTSVVDNSKEEKTSRQRTEPKILSFYRKMDSLAQKMKDIDRKQHPDIHKAYTNFLKESQEEKFPYKGDPLDKYLRHVHNLAKKLTQKINNINFPVSENLSGKFKHPKAPTLEVNHNHKHKPPLEHHHNRRKQGNR